MAPSKTSTKSSSESSQVHDENHISIGGKLYHPYKIVTQHVWLLDELLDVTYPKYQGDEKELTKQLKDVVRTLKPSFPEPLCRECLERSFPVREWRPPDGPEMDMWVKEAKDRKGKPTLKSVTDPQHRILSSFLFNMLTDPDNAIENTEEAVYRLWEASFVTAHCVRCETPVLCGKAGRDLAEKVGTYLDTGEMPTFNTEEAVSLIHLILEDKDAAKKATNKKDEECLNNYLRGLSVEDFSRVREKLFNLAR